MAATITLTGILATTDQYMRLRLLLVDRLEGDKKTDQSWKKLKDAIVADGAVPYKMPGGGAPDDAGVRGECWISLPAARRDRLVELAAELRGKEVAIDVKPKRYAFATPEGPKKGTSLQFVNMQKV